MVLNPIESERALDEDQLTRALDGDRAALEALADRYYPRLHRVALRVLGCPHEAQDAVQEAMLSAFRRIDTLENTALLGPWLHRIALHAALARLRAKNRSGVVPIDPLLPEFSSEGWWATAPDPAADRALAQLESGEQWQRVRSAIESLPADHRELLLLRDVFGVDTRSASEVLGIAETNVKVRLHRARLALRALLTADDEETS